MANFVIKCCKGCVSRSPGCHSTCPEYIVQKAEHEAMMVEYREWNNVRTRLDNQLFDVVGQARKKMGANNKKGVRTR